MHHNAYFPLEDHIWHQERWKHLEQYKLKELCFWMCARGRPKIEGPIWLFILFACITDKRGSWIGLFLHQAVGILVCLKLYKHINVLHIVKVRCFYNICLIIHSIHSNNKLVDWYCSDVHPQDGVFGSYPIRGISNNRVNILTAGFLE